MLAVVLGVAACSSGAASSTPTGATPTATATPRAPTAPASGTPTPSPTPSPSPTTGDVASAGPSPTAALIAWTTLEPAGTAPAPREDHTWTVEPGTRAAWLFAGRDGGRSFNDLWRFDLATDAWTEVEPANAGPAARFGHTATWVDGVGLVVWAGQANASTFFDDLWAFDPAANEWQALPASGARPAARYGSCAALGPDGRVWVSHGFTADAGRFADTWAYDFAAGRWTDETPGGNLPVERCLHDCLWTPDGRLVIYAGQTTGTPAIGDLWSRPVDGSWTRAAKPEPAPRQLYALAAAGGTAWVFGGGAEDRSKLGDLWALDLGTLGWREVRPAGEAPSARSGAALVADLEAGGLLLFGGLTGEGATAETWRLTTGG